MSWQPKCTHYYIITAVGGHVGGWVVYDPSLKRRTQCWAGSCGGGGGGVSIDHIEIIQHSLNVIHLLSLMVVLTQQCCPSGLLRVGPRDREIPALTAVVNNSAPAATPCWDPNVLPLGSCHTTPVVSEV